MGKAFSQFVQLFRGVQDAKLLMVGLDAAGKTSILYQLKLDSFINTVPTVGMWNIMCGMCCVGMCCVSVEVFVVFIVFWSMLLPCYLVPVLLSYHILFCCISYIARSAPLIKIHLPSFCLCIHSLIPAHKFTGKNKSIKLPSSYLKFAVYHGKL